MPLDTTQFPEHAERLVRHIPCCRPSTQRFLADIIQRLSFSRRNRKRCESPEGFNHGLHSWTFSDWFMAFIGEAGEAANVAKKLKRYADGIPGNKESAVVLQKKLALELGDAACYLDLLAQSAGLDIDACREASFQSKSKEIGYVET